MPDANRPQPPLLFLSHAGIDTEAARALKQRLEAAPEAREYGLRVWFDKDCCASIKTPRPATICHTSDGGAAFGGQAGVKPEAARGRGPKGQALHQIFRRTTKIPQANYSG